MKIVSFGELMLRLTPPGYYRFRQADSFTVTFGGAEANVAVSLANFGVNSAYVTKMPDNDIALAARDKLRSFGVDTSGIVYGGERLGIYFVERGASQRPSNVIYDRKNSAVAMAMPSDFDWDKLLDGADAFFYTGITTALCDGVADICRSACETARKKGIKVICDLNYRKKLWTLDKACTVLSDMMSCTDICIGNSADACAIFGISVPAELYEKGNDLTYDGEKYVADELKKRFDLSYVALTVRRTISANVNRFYALLTDKSGLCEFSKEYTIELVDRIGGGDAFSAGIVYSLIGKKSVKESVEFAAAAGCLKQTTEGDFAVSSVAEIEALANGKSDGRVSR
ncbi:MAG: sugar kinase [Clostridia bacterium]|nr:sugar kinase [Clostridia bacterium]